MPAPAHRAVADSLRVGRPAGLRGYADDVATTVLDRLTTVGLIDDADFAEQWVRSRRAHAGKNKRALAAELRTKGVDDEVIAGALEGIDAGAERVRAEELVQRKAAPGRAGDGDDAGVMRRLEGMLARRGYKPEHGGRGGRRRAGGRAGAPPGFSGGGGRGTNMRVRTATRRIAHLMHTLGCPAPATATTRLRIMP